jgi:hypothetical protein
MKRISWLQFLSVFEFRGDILIIIEHSIYYLQTWLKSRINYRLGLRFFQSSEAFLLMR